MIRTTLALSLFLTLSSAWAQSGEEPTTQQQVPQEEEQKPIPVTLIGQTQARRPQVCRLIIHRHGVVQSNEAQIYEAAVSTDDSHEGQGHEEIIATPSNADPRVLDGQNSAKTDRIVIFLAENQQELDVTKAHSYNLVWRHGNHNHTTRCRNLVKQEQPETPSQP